MGWESEVRTPTAAARSAVSPANQGRPRALGEPPGRRSLGEGRFAIASPPGGAIYSVDPTLRREFQALPLRAVTGRPTTVTWLVDGTRLGAASSEGSLSWPLAVGKHDIEARDADGRRARTSVIVR